MKTKRDPLTLIFRKAGALFLLIVFFSIWRSANAATVAPTQILTSGTNVSHRFGSAIALDGDTLVVGAPLSDRHSVRYSGEAYIFVRSGGTWVLEQVLLPPIVEPFWVFGRFVAISGDTVVICHGAYADQTYVYVRSTNGWVLEQTLEVRGTTAAIDGDTILIGSKDGDILNWNDGGVAYIFVRNNGTWTLQQTLTPDDSSAKDDFGVSVALNGNTAVISALGDSDLTDESGRAYVFVRQDTNWIQTQKLRANDPQRGALFGWSIALKDDLLAIGAQGNPDQGYTNAGSAYVFARIAGTWVQQQKLCASNSGPRDGFGYSIALNTNQLVIGQFDEAYPSVDQIPSGAAYVFTNSSGSWIAQVKLAPNEGQLGDLFGAAVASHGDSIVVGDPSDSGSAYIYELLIPSGGGVLSVSQFKRSVSIRNTPPTVSLSFASDFSRSYTVQSTDSIHPASFWQTVTNLVGNGSTLTVPINPAVPRQFYRVLLNQ